MKKLIFFALCVPMVLSSLQGNCQTANEFTINVRIGTAEKPARAFLMSEINGKQEIDSVDVVNNTFRFKGIAEEPFSAAIGINYIPESDSEKITDYLRIYVEQGTITITSADSIKNATVAGSAATEDFKAWSAKTAELNKELAEFRKWYNALTPEELGLEATRIRINEFSKRNSEQQEKIAAEFLAANPGSWFALKTVYPILIGRDKNSDAAQAVLNKFTPEMRATKLGRQYQAQIDSWKTIQIGRTAPDFTQNDPDGTPVKLSDFRGQWVLVDFWASWCGPCRAENPHVVAAYNQFKDKGFTVLGISLDNDKAAWLKAIEADKLEWKQVSDIKGWKNEVAKLYSVSGIPANFLINPEGVIVEKNLRGDDLTAALEKHLGAGK